ncbi:D-tagatose-bisphosphate aldolase, class II, non-catalytic subunit [Agrobacterium rhizogenes]|uniref:D-tagatose-bisphosphate aldolase, class II, non-catalytic subunit n=1 Tax=Rhizobium rhizogenes TaxID=359 RepID=UPI00115EEF0D|nr:D-tagatose-bisphosphate aldolase, class II, non-catalytic subunit [Rhizobium rhizogenes]KAA6488805.1 D-tagatose-bisphosphate aldolase, class II, non-catalytic subunit [Agrobacterium sp. ICMP 7243]NTF52441.1 D-tagatose-bisphosphate aldolase, class II, non-catalytic subunit [Rhizobium rhizogenes]NTF65450.1 D-tagatose-bisphosphate aldolase, class II, non-catalytic subunit [Rhizobium rhizogenes]NTG04454.1 D-tagatose-bisphosphate aldolase, class II, non-catalytic subunit [Rhizobium rhizogenes]NT
MSSATQRLANMPRSRGSDLPSGITSVCSAHPLVIEAALSHAKGRNADVLIEATCNQVNQDGGYTGMTPADFRAFVEKIAAAVGFPLDRLILGGDHLGPNPWKHLPSSEAMRKAGAMIDAFAAAGFTKLHLDTSMACADDPTALPDETIASRAAELAAISEARIRQSKTQAPSYIIGTEVPVPGGAFEALDHLHVTTPGDARATVELHRTAFSRLGLNEAFERSIGIVVQPGVEFGNADVVAYVREAARDLVATLDEMPQFVFEAHSTDYQSGEALRDLVSDGFAILKVGPWLTFALREALYGLSAIAEILVPDAISEALPAAMERIMLSSPEHWLKYYPGDAREQYVQRHYSFSDRIRYYWTVPAAQEAVDELMAALQGVTIPRPLISQHLGHLESLVADGSVAPQARALLLASVTRVLDIYADAIDSASQN